MSNKIFRGIFTSCILIMAMTVGLIAIVLNNYFVSVEESRIASQAQLAAAGIDASGADYFKHLEIDGYRLTWIDKDGTVLFDSEADAATMENHRDRQEVKEAFLNGTGESDRNSSTVAQETMYYAKRCDDGTVVRLSVSRNSIFMLLLSLATPILWIMVAAVTVAFFMGKKISQRIAEPLNHIDLDHLLENQNVEEIRPLLIRIDEQKLQINEQLESLHQKQKEFITATSSMREGLILINKDHQIVSENPAAERLLHLQPLHDQAFETNNEDLNKYVEIALEGEQNTGIITLDDKIIRVDASPITSHGILIGASVLMYDISQEYTTEMQRKEFTANVSHELKTPLQSIMGSAELLENHLVKDADVDSFLHRIRQESKRLLVLIDDIIRLSQLDENQQMEKDEIDLKDTVKEACDTLTKSAQEKNVTLHINTNKALVYGNSRLLYEIVYNLVDNAIRYNHDPGSVTIETYQENDYAILKVSDTGIGIPELAQKRIFERFYRVDKSHSRATGGTGLGLSIVKHAVQISKGTIQLESQEGVGSTFTVLIPLK